MNIAVITGSRADRAALTPVAKALGAFWVHVEVWPSQCPSDSAISCGNAIGDVTERLMGLNPDLVIVDGDRFEILGATISAFLLNIPIAHLCGGDVTEGSQDNSMRHAITKLSHIHFASNPASALRIVAMGEEGWRVHAVGSPQIDQLLETPLLSRDEVRQQIGYQTPYNLVAYQPATLSSDPVGEAEQLLEAIKKMQLPCVFTEVNTDAFGRQIYDLFIRFCLEGNGVMMEMPHQLYYSVMKYCNVMVGNSSSGLYEAPTLKVPFVNVGDRQRGRVTAASVVNCVPETQAIIEACIQARDLDCKNVVNPYGDGQSAQRIKTVVEEALKLGRNQLLTKRQIDVGPGNFVIPVHKLYLPETQTLN